MPAKTKAELQADNERLQKRVAALERARAKSATQAKELKALRAALRDAEQRLRLDDQRYDLAMRAVNEGIYDWDVAGGTIYYSDRLQLAVGMTPEVNRTPQDWRGRIHPDDLAEFDRRLLEHFKGRADRFECDYRFRALDDTWRWARQHGIAIIGADGRVTRMIGSTGDITALKQTEAALNASEERYALAMRAATEGIYEWNIASGDLYLSDRARDFWGFPPGELKNADWLAHMHPEDVAAYRAALIAHFKGQEPQVDLELRVRDARGEYRWAHDRGAAVRDRDGRATRLIGAVGDVTERRRAEELLRQAHEKTKEALERQTATADILRAMSDSPDSVQPVFETIAANVLRLFGGMCCGVVTVRDGQLHVASGGGRADVVERFGRMFPVPLNRDSVAGRAILDRKVQNVADMADPALPGLARTLGAGVGARALLGVPMLREGVAIGAIILFRDEVGAFRPEQVALLQTFADQAAIAVENVRLNNETREALERQTATAEILKVIARSPSNVQPVFDVIARNSNELLAGHSTAVARVYGASLHLVGFAATSEVADAALRNSFPQPISTVGLVAKVLREGLPGQIVDTEADQDIPKQLRDLARTRGFRSMLFVPLIRDSESIGVISVTRCQPGEFSRHHIEVLKTFADQAVIAIRNVRLFEELEARTEQLTRTVEQLTALGEVGQAISSTLDMDTVLRTIVSHAVKLAALDGGVIYEYDGEADRFELRASENFGEQSVTELRAAELRKGEGAVGTSVVNREPVQVPDTHAPDYPARLRGLLERAGFRAVLAVPLMREDTIIGALMVVRTLPGPFSPAVVDLLKTFASQSALAIQNARLFREIAEKGRQLETASRHKSDFLASMSHELRTPLNAILGFIELILGEVYGEVPADMQEPLTDIQASGKHLLRLINNVLDLAKIEAGRMELSLSDYSVHDTVESVRQTLRPLAAEKGLEFVVALPDDLPLAYGDGGRLTQCLMNLAGNSLKFTKAGRVEISVELAGETLVYRVADTGIGIPPDKIDSLFTEFKQTDAAIASEYGGTGLGLSISKKFVEMHGGRIWIESELGRGSTFIFEVPLRVAVEISA